MTAPVGWPGSRVAPKTGGMICRACHGVRGALVLDLGKQPPCDYFPDAGDPSPDPLYPLQMWLCESCGLAQLVADPTLSEEPRGAEPAALVAQAAAAVDAVGAAGLLPPGGRVAEYGSPHGGSWLGLLAGQGLRPVDDHQAADVIVDCFGMMHAADQAEALAERAWRLAPGGTLLLQYHALATIIRCGQWNALRHGHYAYYSTTALTAMLAAYGLRPRRAWQFDLYGGTVLLAAGSATGAHGRLHDSVRALLEEDERAGVRKASVLRLLQREVGFRAGALHEWLVTQRAAKATVLGYGAASRAVSYLKWADIDSSLLPAVADASAAKHGRRMPGTDIPIVDPGVLIERRPDVVLLFLPDLLEEVRRSVPEVEDSGATWMDVDALASPGAPAATDSRSITDEKATLIPRGSR
ncbi:MAG: hypothetical protein J2P57_01195 [Acidimicrobiaceae bacterium]|nr:hypothetical protein [Acidimicrobiaceae bacterium]